MRTFVAGCVVGMLVGASFTAFANQQDASQTIAGWLTGARLMEANRIYRVGYAAGVSDGFAMFQWLMKNQDVAVTGPLTRTGNCFKDRSAGSPEQFTDFAETIWRGSPYQAAAALITGACKE